MMKERITEEELKLSFEVNKCNKCGCDKIKVIETRRTSAMIKRRRKCMNCGADFVTVEINEDALIDLVYSNK